MARPPGRIDPILATIARIWKKYPDLRLGQILVNATGHTGDMFFYEDDKLLHKLIEYEQLTDVFLGGNQDEDA